MKKVSFNNSVMRAISKMVLFAFAVTALSLTSCSGDDDKGGSDDPATAGFTKEAQTKIQSFGKSVEGQKLVAYYDYSAYSMSYRTYIVVNFTNGISTSAASYAFYPNTQAMRAAFAAVYAELAAEGEIVPNDSSESGLYFGQTVTYMEGSTYAVLKQSLVQTGYTIVE